VHSSVKLRNWTISLNKEGHTIFDNKINIIINISGENKISFYTKLLI